MELRIIHTVGKMMINQKICDWLMNNADAPIRYRVARYG
jgi:hypothetical protein